VAEAGRETDRNTAQACMRGSAYEYYYALKVYSYDTYL